MAKTNVRYIVSNVDEALPFYERLGFTVDIHPAPGFARLVRDDLNLLLNQPQAGGAGQSSNAGQAPSPGGWNRFQIEVDDIEAVVGRATRSWLQHQDGRRPGQRRAPGGCR